MEGLQLERIAEGLTKQEQRDIIRDMVAMVIQQNTTPEPPADSNSAAAVTAVSTPTAVA